MIGSKKYCPEIVGQIIKFIEAGNYIKTACDVVGIGTTTYRRWMKRYPSFEVKIRQAEAQAVARNVTIIQVAAKTNWTAAAWFLERKDYKSWGRKSQIGGIDDSPITVKTLGKEYEDKSKEDLIKEFENELDTYQKITTGSGGGPLKDKKT